MGLLRRENWIVWLLLTFLTQGFSVFVLAYFLDCYDKNAWYAKWQYWVFGAICMLFPVFVMLLVFNVQMQVAVAKKLSVAGADIYAQPYSWILCMVVPVLGWALFLVMLVYIQIWPLVKLYQGAGEKYIK